ncbi:MAG TPA: ATP-binding protein [Candidatus Eremiobacteraceae bacterium]|nr:ATP-binding protein [Candidatus Eremiobacteraceae bacterium]
MTSLAILAAIVLAIAFIAAIIANARLSRQLSDARSSAAVSGAQAKGSTSEAAATARLAALLDALPVGVVVIDDDARVTAFNAAASDILGVQTERAVGRALIESVRSYDLDRRLLAALREGVEGTAEVPLHAASDRSLRITTKAVHAADGTSEAIAIVVDLTRVRELEALRRDFVSNVSHELRTPLAAMKIMIETLQSGADGDVAAGFLRSLAAETDRMVVLVEELLDLARLESGKLEMRLGTIDLGALCRDVVATHMPRARSLGIALNVSVPAETISIIGDRDRLVQVVSNLLDNALRHTSSGGHVEVGLSPARGLVTLYVQDDGPGIPFDALPHIFERFYVVDRSRSRSAGGTGLGLAIVKHIVESHGGSITAESELNRGTTFRCTFSI